MVACGYRRSLVSGYLIRNVLWKMVPYLSSEMRNQIGLLVYRSLKA